MASRGSSANKGRISSSSLPTPALASQLNASVMQQQLGKSPVPQCVRAARAVPHAAAAPGGQHWRLTRPQPFG